MQIKIFTEINNGNIPLKEQLKDSELEKNINEFIKSQLLVTKVNKLVSHKR